MTRQAVSCQFTTLFIAGTQDNPQKIQQGTSRFGASILGAIGEFLAQNLGSGTT